jgi:subtilisin family serine protease
MIAPPAELNNKEGVNLHRSNVLNSRIRGLGYGLTGKGVTLGLWDADVENHRDFGKRIKVREFEMHTTDHGTHTCGTIGSAGLLDPSTRGMAPEINIVSWNFNTSQTA